MKTRDLAIVLAIAAILRIFVAFVLPFGQVVKYRLEGLNDEPAHLNYIKYLAVNQRLPVQEKPFDAKTAFIENEFEYYQPPLYYAITSLLYSSVRHWDERDALVACRLLAVLIGLVGLACTFGFLRIVIQDRTVFLLSSVLASVLPTHVYFTSLVSNDCLTWSLSAAVLYIVAQQLSLGAGQKIWPWRTSVILGILTGAGLLTKTSTLFLLPSLVVAGLILWRKHRTIRILIQPVIACSLGILIAAPWYFRNHALYGSFLAIEMGFGDLNPLISSLSGAVAFVKVTIRYFWFPMQHLPFSLWVSLINLFGGGIVLVTMAGCLSGLYRRRDDAVVLFCLFTAFFAFAPYVRLNLSWSNAEARFLFPAYPAIIALFGVAAEDIRRRIGFGGAATLAMASVLPYTYLLVIPS